MTEVVGAIKRVTDLMGEISTASNEQSQGVSQVGEAVTQMIRSLDKIRLWSRNGRGGQQPERSGPGSRRHRGVLKLAAPQSAWLARELRAWALRLQAACGPFARRPLPRWAVLPLDRKAPLSASLDNAIQSARQLAGQVARPWLRRRNLDADAVSRDDCCELGKWLHGAGSLAVRRQPVLCRVESRRQIPARRLARWRALMKPGAPSEAEKQLESNTSFLQCLAKSGCCRDPVGRGGLKVKMAGAATSKKAAATPARGKSPTVPLPSPRRSGIRWRLGVVLKLHGPLAAVRTGGAVKQPTH